MQITEQEYQQFRPLLFSIGYRMLGSVVETEDLVQETFLKAYQLSKSNVEFKKAYLCKMMTNRCLDVLKSARHKREQYIGPWNPEPLLLEKVQAFDPSEMLMQKEGLSIAYLRMMEHLTPDERAILLLKEVFDFSYAEIADLIRKKEDNCRKIFSRAKQKISDVEGESLDFEKNASLIERFVEAFNMQDMDVLLDLVSENVTLFSDGGGKVTAAVRPIVSVSSVLALLYGVMKKAPEDFFFEIKNVNLQPAVVIYMNGKIQSVLSFYIRDEKIVEMYIIMNPDKLPVH
ncbi:RNA polymerase sigma-70 factor [Exiguobacterium flavidum]|uniref:RNA polymerase sigma-70 factor n=1 Tax=Exiguobacterium flavidum TaxID=2184695 RepID=UPI000DF7BE3F|nr:RNA polymerase sigma-70 factor [Exiguobacterium flavidum]